MVSLLKLARKRALRKRGDAQHGGDDGLGIERLTIAFYGVQRQAPRPLLA
jgi:aspartyl/asparaginyl-tRNA synthetase